MTSQTSPSDSLAPEPSPGIARRTVIRGAAWSVPAITAVASTPSAHAASSPGCTHLAERHFDVYAQTSGSLALVTGTQAILRPDQNSDSYKYFEIYLRSGTTPGSGTGVASAQVEITLPTGWVFSSITGAGTSDAYSNNVNNSGANNTNSFTFTTNPATAGAQPVGRIRFGAKHIPTIPIGQQGLCVDGNTFVVKDKALDNCATSGDYADTVIISPALEASHFIGFSYNTTTYGEIDKRVTGARTIEWPMYDTRPGALAGVHANGTTSLYTPAARQYSAMGGAFASLIWIDQAGKLWGRGYNSGDQLGSQGTGASDGNYAQRLFASGSTEFNETIIYCARSTEDQGSMVVGTNGKAYATGVQMFSNWGNGSSSNVNHWTEIATTLSFRNKPSGTFGAAVPAGGYFPNAKIIAAERNIYTALYLLDNGYVWGNGMMDNPTSRSVAAGANPGSGTGDGAVRGGRPMQIAAWSGPVDGRLGTPATNVTSIATTHYASAVIRTVNGEPQIWNCGDTTYGGNGQYYLTRLTPTGWWANKTPARVISGRRSMWVIFTDGTAGALGANQTSMLGTGGSGAAGNTLTQVAVGSAAAHIGSSRRIVDIQGGNDGTVFLCDDGTMYFAGNLDNNGPVGTAAGALNANPWTAGGTGIRATPTRVSLSGPATQIGAHWYDSYFAWIDQCGDTLTPQDQWFSITPKSVQLPLALASEGTDGAYYEVYLRPGTSSLASTGNVPVTITLPAGWVFTNVTGNSTNTATNSNYANHTAANGQNSYTFNTNPTGNSLQPVGRIRFGVTQAASITGRQGTCVPMSGTITVADGRGTPVAEDATAALSLSPGSRFIGFKRNTANGQITSAEGATTHRPIEWPMEDTNAVITAVTAIGGTRDGLVWADQDKKLWVRGTNVSGNLGWSSTNTAPAVVASPALTDASGNPQLTNVTYIARACDRDTAMVVTGEGKVYGSGAQAGYGFGQGSNSTSSPNANYWFEVGTTNRGWSQSTSWSSGSTTNWTGNSPAYSAPTGVTAVEFNKNHTSLWLLDNGFVWARGVSSSGANASGKNITGNVTNTGDLIQERNDSNHRQRYGRPMQTATWVGTADSSAARLANAIGGVSSIAITDSSSGVISTSNFDSNNPGGDKRILTSGSTTHGGNGQVYLTVLTNTTGKTPDKIIGGPNNLWVIMTDGTLWVVGQDVNGASGVGSSVGATLTQVTGDLSGKSVTDVAAGSNSTLFRTSDGGVYFAGATGVSSSIGGTTFHGGPINTAHPWIGRNAAGNITTPAKVKLSGPAGVIGATYGIVADGGGSHYAWLTGCS